MYNQAFFLELINAEKFHFLVVNAFYVHLRLCLGCTVQEEYEERVQTRAITANSVDFITNPRRLSKSLTQASTAATPRSQSIADSSVDASGDGFKLDTTVLGSFTASQPQASGAPVAMPRRSDKQRYRQLEVLFSGGQ